MSALTLCVYLILFYFLPVTGGPVYQWVWDHAREKLPRLMFYHHGTLVWNGAFYVTMLALWIACYLLCVLFRMLVRRDDQQWEGLFTGFQRGAGLEWADALLAVLFAVLVMECSMHHYPVHGPLSAFVAVVSTFCIPALMPGKRFKRGKGGVQKAVPSSTGSAPADPGQPGSSPEQTGAAQPSDAQSGAASDDALPQLPLVTRDLQADEPPPIHVDALRSHVEQIVSPNSMSEGGIP